MANYKNIDWQIPVDCYGKYTNEHVTIAVLMDIRSELQRLNTLMYCQNTVAIPSILRQIARNTVKPKKRRRAAR